MKPITRNPEVDELAASMVIAVAAELMLDSLGPDDIEDPAALGRANPIDPMEVFPTLTAEDQRHVFANLLIRAAHCKLFHTEDGPLDD